MQQHGEMSIITVLGSQLRTFLKVYEGDDRDHYFNERLYPHVGVWKRGQVNACTFLGRGVEVGWEGVS